MIDAKKGDSIFMTVPLPPFLHEEYGESFDANVVYEGLISDEEMAERTSSGSLKVIYNCIDLTEHHIVYWNKEYWINDLINDSNEEINFKPVI